MNPSAVVFWMAENVELWKPLAILALSVLFLFALALMARALEDE